jgi:hypothetical protein
MAKYHIKHWDNFRMFPDEGDSYTTDSGYMDLDSAIQRAKLCVEQQINFKKNKSLEDILDTFKTMGQDPVIYDDETRDPVNAFSSIDYIKELFKKYN